MEYSILLMSKIAAMLIWALIGFTLVRLRVMKTEDSKPLSILVLDVMIPCTIIRAFTLDITADRMKGFAAALLFAAFTMFFWAVLTWLLCRPFHLSEIDQLSLVYSNCGNLVIPLVSMTMGTEYVFYVAAFQLVFNVMIWTHGIIILRGKEDVNFKKIAFSPSIIAMYIAFLLMFTKIRFPDVINTSIQGLADMVGPSSMLILGMVIAGCDLRRIFSSKRAYLIVFGRLIVYPLLIIILLTLTGIIKRDPSFMQILLIGMLSVCAPSASMIPQLAIVYDKDSSTASAYNVISTSFCIVTVPVMIYIFQLLNA